MPQKTGEGGQSTFIAICRRVPKLQVGRDLLPERMDYSPLLLYCIPFSNISQIKNIFKTFVCLIEGTKFEVSLYKDRDNILFISVSPAPDLVANNKCLIHVETWFILIFMWWKFRSYKERI
jgi:hypothetical protein